VLLAIAVGVPTAIWMQPSQRARREYELGLQAQIRAQFDVAREHYQKALEFDPKMGLAAFSMGTTYLRVGDPALVQAMQEIMERAVRGQTRELDEADEWFRRALQIGETLPPGKRLMDQRIRTPAHLRAFSRASLALTAYIRAAAAMQAEQFEQALAWIEVAQREAQAAITDDPGNNPAQQVLRSVEPLIPPPSDMR
jgi:tetratricopeptide (TPR) repeat protein